MRDGLAQHTSLNCSTLRNAEPPTKCDPTWAGKHGTMRAMSERSGVAVVAFRWAAVKAAAAVVQAALVRPQAPLSIPYTANVIMMAPTKCYPHAFLSRRQSPVDLT